MTRLISFSMTEAAVLERRKTVTRRIGWFNLKPGTLLRGVHKAMGLKKGERPRHLALIRVVDVRHERLDAIDWNDVEREGYVAMSPGEFVDKFCRAMRCEPCQIVTRIEFDYVAESPDAAIPPSP